MLVTLFCLTTLAVVFAVELLTGFIVKKIFKKHLLEIYRQEEKIAEYYQLSLLAMVAKDKDALNGIQEMANEVYWQIFFRKLTIFSASFFVLLSPYMLICEKMLSPYISSPFMAVFVLAIVYFLCKTVFFYFRNTLHDRSIAINQQGSKDPTRVGHKNQDIKMSQTVSHQQTKEYTRG